MTKYTIDATGKKLGRVATEAAVLLMGKNLPSFEKRLVSETHVEITNVSKLSIDSRKVKEKKYIRYTGHPGGLRAETLGNLGVRRGYGEALRRAVYGMLPANTLRKKRLKNLVVKE